MVPDLAHVGFTAEIPLPNQGFPARFLGRGVRLIRGAVRSPARRCRSARDGVAVGDVDDLDVTLFLHDGRVVLLLGSHEIVQGRPLSQSRRRDKGQGTSVSSLIASDSRA